MALKEDWKATGKELGGAFSHLGKTLVRSISKGVEAAQEWAKEETEKKVRQPEEKSDDKTEE